MVKSFNSVAGLPKKTVYSFKENDFNSQNKTQTVHLCEVPETHVIDTSTTIGRKMIKRRKNKVRIDNRPFVRRTFLGDDALVLRLKGCCHKRHGQ